MRSTDQIPSSEITPQSVYLNRRAFMKGGIAAASLLTTGWVYRRLNRPGSAVVDTPALAGLKAANEGKRGIASGFRVDEPMTPLQSVSNYNNFYEFTTDKESVAAAAAGFVSKPWQVAVEGMVHKPRVFDLDELMKAIPLEERVYRMRCVEGWSMVIPWSGFPLAKLLERVEPMGGAEYVAFETLLDPERMPGQKADVLPWPYIEGLRMDEAMHPLTLLAVGLYGHELPAQNGAPLRLVVPWKYGFKGIKSIVKITLVANAAGDDLEHEPHRTSTASSPTLTPRSTTRGGVRRPSNGSASRVVGRRSCSTAMARRWPISTRAWTCGQTSEAAARMKVTRFARFTVLLNCAVPVILLGWDAWRGQLGANPVNFAIRTTGLLSLIFLLLTLLVTPVSRITRWSWLGQFRRMLGLCAFFHACLHFLIFFGFDRGASASSTLSEIIKRPYLMVGTIGLVLDGAAGGDLDRRHDQAPGRQALEGAAPAGIRRRRGGRGPLLHAREGRRHPAGRVCRRAGGFPRLPTGRPLLAAPIGVRRCDRPPSRSLRPPPPPGGKAEVLVGATEGGARSSTRRPRCARFASCRPTPPACRSTSCPASI